ncbi:MAG: hypothetical protein AABY30_06200 [Candidatus Thermoplasmatota archaeon]
MRRALSVLLLALLLAPVASPAASAHTVGSPAYVNFLLDHFQTPDLAPGERGEFRVTFTNMYPWNMSDIRLRFEVYRYREIDVSIPVDVTWTHDGPSFFDEFGTDYGLAIEPPVLGPNLTGEFLRGESEEIAFTVVTYPETPHGSLTSQGSYFVRTRLDFQLSDGTTTNVSTMMSIGFFTEAEVEVARRPCNAATSYCSGLFNMTYLGSVYGLDHLDGIVPDTAFSVKERMPLWPFVATGGVMVASLVFAVLFYAEENPGKYPRLAQWWLGVKGKARSARPPKKA